MAHDWGERERKRKGGREEGNRGKSKAAFRIFKVKQKWLFARPQHIIESQSLNFINILAANNSSSRKEPADQIQFSSVQFSHSVVSDSLQPHEPQHARPSCPSPIPRVHPNPCPSSWWCHLTISSSVVPFSSCPQSFPASGSFQMNQLFTWGGQSIGVSVLTWVLPMNTQNWSPLGWTGWISLQSKGLSRGFSNTTVQKHQFFSVQLSLWSNSHIHTWLLEKMDFCWQSNGSAF